MNSKREKVGEERNNCLFKVLQYVERQVVLVDALEDAAYSSLHNLSGKGLVERTHDAHRTAQET